MTGMILHRVVSPKVEDEVGEKQPPHGVEGEVGAGTLSVPALGESGYRDTLLTRNTPLLGPFSRTIPGVLWWS